MNIKLLKVTLKQMHVKRCEIYNDYLKKTSSIVVTDTP